MYRKARKLLATSIALQVSLRLTKSKSLFCYWQLATQAEKLFDSQPKLLGAKNFSVSLTNVALTFTYVC